MTEHNLPTKPSWSCSTSCGRASGLEDYCPRCGVIESSCVCNYETPERKITASSRRSIAGVGTDGAASASASQPSYLLAPGDPASDKGARGDDRAHAPPATIPAAGYAALGRGPRNPRSLVTGSGAGLALSCSGGAAVARLAHNQEVVGSIPTPATSSGDGLGIQQPGSITWGGLFVPTAPSGRADESAMCPAVARSFHLRLPAADRAGAPSIKVEGHLVLRCPRAAGVFSRSLSRDRIGGSRSCRSRHSASGEASRRDRGRPDRPPRARNAAECGRQGSRLPQARPGRSAVLPAPSRALPARSAGAASSPATSTAVSAPGA